MRFLDEGEYDQPICEHVVAHGANGQPNILRIIESGWPFDWICPTRETAETLVEMGLPRGRVWTLTELFSLYPKTLTIAEAQAIFARDRVEEHDA